MERYNCCVHVLILDFFSQSLLTKWIIGYLMCSHQVTSSSTNSSLNGLLGNGSPNQVSLGLMRANWFLWQQGFHEEKCIHEIILNTERMCVCVYCICVVSVNCGDVSSFTHLFFYVLCWSSYIYVVHARCFHYSACVFILTRGKNYLNFSSPHTNTLLR